MEEMSRTDQDFYGMTDHLDLGIDRIRDLESREEVRLYLVDCLERHLAVYASRGVEFDTMLLEHAAKLYSTLERFLSVDFGTRHDLQTGDSIVASGNTAVLVMDPANPTSATQKLLWHDTRIHGTIKGLKVHNIYDEPTMRRIQDAYRNGGERTIATRIEPFAVSLVIKNAWISQPSGHMAIEDHLETAIPLNYSGLRLMKVIE